MLKGTSCRVSFWPAALLTICVFYLREFPALKTVRAAPTNGQELEIKLTSAAIEHVNPEYIGKDPFLRITRLSRDTPPVMNGFFLFIKDWPMKVNNTYIVYKKMSNKWRESFIKGAVDFCEILPSKMVYYRYIYDFTNLPHKCPVRKGNFTINKFNLNFGNMPFIAGLSANQEWKIKLSYVTFNAPILAFSFECRLEPKTNGHHSASSRPHHE